MSYTPTNWQTGDTITAEKLNNMEQDIENANEPFTITLTPTNPDYSGAMDKTPQEITEAYNEGRRIRGDIAGMNASFDFTQYGENAVDGQTVIALRGNVIVNMSMLGGSGFALFSIGTEVSSSTYTADIFPLTPMT